MAVGDAVIARSGNNAVLTYQPAAGVEVAVTFCADSVGGGTTPFQSTDGATHIAVALASKDIGLTRWLLNNTYYLRAIALGAGNYTFFTGLQTNA